MQHSKKIKNDKSNEPTTITPAPGWPKVEGMTRLSIPVSCAPEWLQAYSTMVAADQVAAQCLVLHSSLTAAASVMRARLEDLGVKFDPPNATATELVTTPPAPVGASSPDAASLSSIMRSKLKLVAWLRAERDRLAAGGAPVAIYPKTLRQAIGLVHSGDKAFIRRLTKAVVGVRGLELKTSYNGRLILRRGL